VNKRGNLKIDMEGGGDDFGIVEKFATFFEQACTPNSEQFDKQNQNEFNSKFSDYTGDAMPAEKLAISAEIVSVAVLKINKGKAPGCDGIMLEHLLHCHPIIYSLLAKLFNRMLCTGHVPSDFGRGILVPLLKDDKLRGAHKVGSFRGITLSPVISKVFEHCLMELLNDYLYTDDHQFGFKPNVECSHALYTVRHVVDYFVRNDSTINLCLVDVSKAFDKLNHSVLWLKLMQRRVPRTFLIILKNWYDNESACVRWNNMLSHTFRVRAGVRQGGILSPVLFLIYVNDMLTKLTRSGCKIA
jgi:hypothetical protein